jgi:hypothetical protein
MFINKMMMESWQKITLVAYMLGQGTLLSIDEEGILSMTRKKDKQFHFLCRSFDDIVKDERNYDATKAEMAKQDTGLMRIQIHLRGRT